MNFLERLGELLRGHHKTLRQHIDRRFDAIEQEIRIMSQSLSDQLNAALAAISADVDAVGAEVTALLAALQGQVGQPVTQAMVDAATNIDARLKAIPPAPAP